MADSEIDLKAKYTNILKENGIEDEIAQVTLAKPDFAGENMGSIIELARVEFEDGQKPLELFLKKRLPSCGVEIMDNAVKQMMLREGQYLKDFTKELEQLSEERTTGSESLTKGLFPKIYYYDEDVIIMENLMKQGYKVLPKKERQDFKDASVVVRNLAKLHAVSFVMVENAGGKEKFLEKNPNLQEHMFKPESKPVMSHAFEPGFALALEVLKKSTHEEKDEKYEILRQYEGKLVDCMYEPFEAENLFHCVLHGDFWNNNIMFDETREKIVLVDFQFSRVGSPNLDLCYFLFTSTKTEVRKRWKELLQIYFDALKSNLASLGQSFEFTFEDFVKEFIRKSKGGFFAGFFLIIGMEAMAGHDTSKPSDGFTNVFTEMATKWVAENPEKAQAAGESMISMVNDYLLFGRL